MLGFFSGDTNFLDHDFALADLTEVKPGAACEAFNSRMDPSAATPATWIADLHPSGPAGLACWGSNWTNPAKHCRA
jgi:hypothetical protein